MIGMIRDDGLEPHQQKLIDEKRRELENQPTPYTPTTGEKLGDFISRRGTFVLEMSYQGHGASGRLHDLSQLRRLEVQLMISRGPIDEQP